jgi:protein-tyrosine-phosphatase/DNA-binding transcriptional ArsR family regulator
MITEVSPGRVADRARAHAALADPHRLAIVDELVVSDRSPSELAESLGLASNLVAHHMGVLQSAGLIERLESHGDRRRRYVRLRARALWELTRPVRLQTAEVLFVCTGNSARSQLAAALWNQVHVVPAQSGGTRPAARVHPEAVRIARSFDIDLEDARPRAVEPHQLESALVVTVCDQAHEALTGSARPPFVHWSVADPAAVGDRESFRVAAEQISGRVHELAPLVAPVP